MWLNIPDTKQQNVIWYFSKCLSKKQEIIKSETIIITVTDYQTSAGGICFFYYNSYEG